AIGQGDGLHRLAALLDLGDGAVETPSPLPLPLRRPLLPKNEIVGMQPVHDQVLRRAHGSHLQSLILGKRVTTPSRGVAGPSLRPAVPAAGRGAHPSKTSATAKSKKFKQERR